MDKAKIKAGLAYCGDKNASCEHCPYSGEENEAGVPMCVPRLATDALALIAELERKTMTVDCGCAIGELPQADADEITAAVMRTVCRR